MTVAHYNRQPPDRLPLDTLHGAASDTNQCGHLEYGMPGAQMLADGGLDLGRHFRTTQLLPLRPDAVQPGVDLLRIMCRSCSPETDAIWIMARPIGVVLSMACWSE
jgi:hypothetical protein